MHKDPRIRAEYHQRYREAHREKARAYNKQYREKNRERLNKANKEFYLRYKLEHPEKLSEAGRRSYLKHRDKVLAYQRKYYASSLEVQRERRRRYYQENKEKKALYGRAYYRRNKSRYAERHREAYRNNIQYRLRCRLRTRLWNAIRGGFKNGSAVRDLGCSIQQLKTYLSNQFKEGMSWDNYGRWHIDHIMPLDSFDLTDRRQFLDAFHFTNLQPLWARENTSKGNKKPPTRGGSLSAFLQARDTHSLT